jgi:two-component system, OmpR family, phosphate regulon sensor histidine kinase PhoR
MKIEAVKRLHVNLNLTSVIVMLSVGVILPVMLLAAVGIVALAFAENAGTIVTGILVICFAVTAAGSALSAVVLAGRKARLARRQADFVANVTHELRTPLSAIRLFAQTLESGKLEGDPAKTADCVATILRETQWLDFMIDKVLTWRAASKDALPLDMRAAPLRPAIEAAAERFRSMVPDDEMAFSVAIDTDRPVRHDVRAFNTLVLNLLTNAYKYSGQDKHIGVAVCDDEESVVIEVSDNGIGFSPRDAKRVFQPFYRVDHALSGPSAGVGLGLAIVRRLVNYHGGSIDVRSEEGQGSVFVIRLPAVSVSDEQQEDS